MEKEEFIQLIKLLVSKATTLKNNYLENDVSKVNYACIFCQSEEEYLEFENLAQGIGKVIKKTNSGNLYNIIQIETVSGKLKILKIRIPDKSKPERGDADFTIEGNFEEFKTKYLQKENFNLIKRDYMEMVEIWEKGKDVRVYFSNPPLDKQFNIK